LETVVTKVHEPFSTLFHYFSQHDSRGNKDWLVIFLLPADKIADRPPWLATLAPDEQYCPLRQREDLKNVTLPVTA